MNVEREAENQLEFNYMPKNPSDESEWIHEPYCPIIETLSQDAVVSYSWELQQDYYQENNDQQELQAYTYRDVPIPADHSICNEQVDGAGFLFFYC